MSQKIKQQILTDPALCENKHYLVMLGGASGNNPQLTNYTIYGCRRCGVISVRAMKGDEEIHIDFDITQPDIIEAIVRNHNNSK